MPLYETIFIARQDLSADDVDALTAKLSKIITDGNGKVVSKEYWGLRNLTYKIKKNSRGHYVALNINAPYPAVAELKRVIGFNEDIIRSATYAVEAHEEESLLFVSKTAKDYKPAKEGKTKRGNEEQSKIDLVLNNVQFDI
jgi:small subunit ribosomal protein S6